MGPPLRDDVTRVFSGAGLLGQRVHSALGGGSERRTAGKMINDQGRVIREVMGPKPFCMALKAVCPKTIVDTGRQIRAWRNEELRRNEYGAYAKNHYFGVHLSKAEDLRERKRLHLDVQKRVDMEMQAYLAGEEERKERLRNLLEAEEKTFMAEMESREESIEDRRINMRLRAKELREKREEAQRKLVAEKRELQFREDCEEGRKLFTEKQQAELYEDRLAQLALNEELKKQKEMEEAMYTALWEEDRLAKEKRAFEEERKRSGRDEDMINTLNTQRAMMEAQKAEAKRLKEEEAKLMEEERQLMKLENEQAEIERQRKMRECGNMLLDSMKEKAKRLSEEKQNEIALDMKILDHVLKESVDDTESQKQRKKELFKEQQMYHAYLAQQREEEKQKEKELERFRAEDMAKMWAKRAEKENALKLARDRLLKDVMDTRKLQIEEKLQRNAREQETLLRDKELLIAAMEEYHRLEDQIYARHVEKAKHYRDGLQAQMEYQKQVREFEKEEKHREYVLAQEEEKLYQQKLADILSRPYMKLKFLHPLKRQMASSSNS